AERAATVRGPEPSRRGRRISKTDPPREDSPVRRPRIAPLPALRGAAALLALLATAATAQTARTPAGAAGTSLARYVPAKELLFYAEFDGLDAHADAWKKTAAYKLLNETTLGALLEDLASQGLDKALAPSKVPNKPTSAEILAAVKAVVKGGFVFA